MLLYTTLLKHLGVEYKESCRRAACIKGSEAMHMISSDYLHSVQTLSTSKPEDLNVLTH